MSTGIRVLFPISSFSLFILSLVQYQCFFHSRAHRLICPFMMHKGFAISSPVLFIARHLLAATRAISSAISFRWNPQCPGSQSTWISKSFCFNFCWARHPRAAYDQYPSCWKIFVAPTGLAVTPQHDDQVMTIDITFPFDPIYPSTDRFKGQTQPSWLSQKVRACHT